MKLEHRRAHLDHKRGGQDPYQDVHLVASSVAHIRGAFVVVDRKDIVLLLRD